MEFSQIQSDINNQESNLHQMQSDIISFEQSVFSKANALNTLKPKIIKSNEYVSRWIYIN